MTSIYNILGALSIAALSTGVSIHALTGGGDNPTLRMY